MIVSFLASHGGSSAKHIIRTIKSGGLDAEVGCVITNNRDSGIHQWCNENAVPIVHISRKTQPDRYLEDESISETLLRYETELPAHP